MAKMQVVFPANEPNENEGGIRMGVGTYPECRSRIILT